MDQNLKSKSQDRLTKAQNILIASPRDSNFDAVAAALSLYLSCTKLGKNTTVVSKSPTISEAKSLYGVGKIGKISSSGLVISIKDAINTVDKVSHFLDKNDLKILVHPLSGSSGASKDDVSFEKAPIKPDYIFTIGFESIDQLKKEVLKEQNINSETWIVAINIHAPSQKFAQVSVSSPAATSFCEVSTQLLQELALPLDEDIAFNLYSGLANATENFSLDKISSTTFQIASFLVKFGANKASFVKLPKPTDKNLNSSQLNTEAMEQSPLFPKQQKSVEEIEKGSQEAEKRPFESETEWLKPPKIYKGTQSFDKEN